LRLMQDIVACQFDIKYTMCYNTSLH